MVDFDSLQPADHALVVDHLWRVAQIPGALFVGPLMERVSRGEITINDAVKSFLQTELPDDFIDRLRAAPPPRPAQTVFAAVGLKGRHMDEEAERRVEPNPERQV